MASGRVVSIAEGWGKGVCGEGNNFFGKFNCGRKWS